MGLCSPGAIITVNLLHFFFRSECSFVSSSVRPYPTCHDLIPQPPDLFKRLCTHLDLNTRCLLFTFIYNKLHHLCKFSLIFGHPSCLTRINLQAKPCHLAPPHPRVTLTKPFEQTQDWILPISNIERGKGVLACFH